MDVQKAKENLRSALNEAYIAENEAVINRLWDVNLEVREKLGLPQEESDPSVDMLFEGRRQ